MGTDYLEEESYDPREDNLYKGNFLGSVAGFGGLEAAAWGIKKGYGASYDRKVSLMGAKFRNRIEENAMSPRTARTLYQSERVIARASKAEGMALAKTVGRYSKVFGFSSFVIGGFELGRSLSQASRSMVEGRDQAERFRRANVYDGEDQYFDSRAAFTQRQRAIQVIHNSQLSTRAAMGQESSYMHY